MNYILMLDHEEPRQIEIDFDLVKRVLEEQKLPFTFKSYEDEERVHTHEIYCDNGLFEVFISKDKDSVTLDGDWEKTLDFVILFRKTIPESQKLLFFDQGYNNNMIITPEIELSEIKNIFS